MSQKFCNILVHTNLQFKLWKVPTVVVSIMVVGVLTCCALLHSMSDWENCTAEVPHSLIQELLLYDFQLNHNATEAPKKVCCTKSKGAVDHSMVTRCLKKFILVCKNLDDNKVRLAWKCGFWDHDSTHWGKSSEELLETIRQAWHLTVQRGSLLSQPQLKHLELPISTSHYQRIAKILIPLSYIRIKLKMLVWNVN